MPEKPEDSTLLSDISGLIPSHISTQEQLNEWEAGNIQNAVKKYLSKRVYLEITTAWLKKLHFHMFDDTWTWAGKFRTHNPNLGIDHKQINIELKKLTDDINYWKKSNMNILEQSVRIHHKLVRIHPFPNGNGRHARLVADIFLFNNNHPLPQWPDEELIRKTTIREKYIKALKKADDLNYKPLINFTKSLLP